MGPPVWLPSPESAHFILILSTSLGHFETSNNSALFASEPFEDKKTLVAGIDRMVLKGTLSELGDFLDEINFRPPHNWHSFVPMRASIAINATLALDPTRLSEFAALSSEGNKGNPVAKEAAVQIPVNVRVCVP